MSWTPADLLRPAAPASVHDFDGWRGALLALESSGPFALAVLGGRRAGSVGWAFGFGYQAALRAMFPRQMHSRVGALCATEAGGNHPRAIRTKLHDGVLTGEKSFVTLGPLADQLVVVASEGTHPSGHNMLVGCVVDPRQPGVAMSPMPALPFVPELAHGTMRLTGAVPTEVVDGDGYTGLLKPFRTVEDIHVHAAVAAWLLGVAVESGWPEPLVESLLMVVAGLATSAETHPLSPGAHRLLGGALSAFTAVVAEAEPHIAAGPSTIAEMWARDRPLLRVASSARQARLHRAREHFRSVP